MTGSRSESASADLNQQGQWEIRPVFKGGADGIDKFNAGAGQCYAGRSAADLSRPGQIAIVLDNKVLTAPTIDDASFQPTRSPSRGNFTESEANDIATALKYGALPVVLVPADQPRSCRPRSAVTPCTPAWSPASSASSWSGST